MGHPPTNCIGAVVYPALPGVKPELFGTMLEGGSRLGEESANTIAEEKEALKDSLYMGEKLFGNRRTTALAKNLERQAGNAKMLASVFGAVSKIAIANDIYKNLKGGCTVE